MLELQQMSEQIPACCADCLPYMVEKASIYLRLRGSFILNKLGSGLTLEQFITLDAISSCKEICQRDLAKIVLKDRSNITRILKILEEKGLITREPSTREKRIVKLIKLTDEGQEIINKYSLSVKTDLEEFFSDFDKNDIKSFRNVLERIVSKISEKQNIQI